MRRDYSKWSVTVNKKPMSRLERLLFGGAWHWSASPPMSYPTSAYGSGYARSKDKAFAIADKHIAVTDAHQHTVETRVLP